MLRILGVDPGSRVTGVGVIDCVAGQVHCVHYRTIRTVSGDFPQRLGEIFREVLATTEQFQPHQAAVEKVFVNNNAANHFDYESTKKLIIEFNVTMVHSKQ